MRRDAFHSWLLDDQGLDRITADSYVDRIRSIESIMEVDLDSSWITDQLASVIADIEARHELANSTRASYKTAINRYIKFCAQFTPEESASEMADNIENLVLEHLRHMRGKIDNIEADISDIKLRMSSAERHLGEIQMQMAGLNSRMDRFDERMMRVERRLEIHEPAIG